MSFDYRNSRLALVGGLLVTLVGALSGGCTVETTQTQYPYPTEASFCDALAESQCNQSVVTACYGSDQSSLSHDQTSCMSAASRGTNCNPHGVTYHPETAEACLITYNDAYADAAISNAELKTINEACVAVFSANGRDGTGCDSDFDCETGAGQRCLVKQGEEGKCFKPVVVEAGHKCTDKAAQCESGFFCDGANCIAQPVVNEECELGQPCASGAYCSDGVCKKQADNGSDCTSAEECKNGFCLTPKGLKTGSCAATSTLQSTSSNCTPFL